MTAILFSSFLVLLALGFPIAFALAIATLLAVAFGATIRCSSS